MGYAFTSLWSSPAFIESVLEQGEGIGTRRLIHMSTSLPSCGRRPSSLPSPCARQTPPQTKTGFPVNAVIRYVIFHTRCLILKLTVKFIKN